MAHIKAKIRFVSFVFESEANGTSLDCYSCSPSYWLFVRANWAIVEQVNWSPILVAHLA
jgi:hypothetical protein